MLYIMYNLYNRNHFGQRLWHYDTTTAAGIKYLGTLYFNVDPWDDGSLRETGVYLWVRLLSGFEPSCSKSNVVDLIYIAHKWSKDF